MREEHSPGGVPVQQLGQDRAVCCIFLWLRQSEETTTPVWGVEPTAATSAESTHGQESYV